MSTILKNILLIASIISTSSGWASPPTSSTKVGNTYYNSDGTTTTKVGSTYYHSDGTSSTEVGNTVYHSSGGSTTKVGNTYYNSDGTSSTQVGNTTYHSSGGSSTQVGNTHYHSGGTKLYHQKSPGSRENKSARPSTNPPSVQSLGSYDSPERIQRFQSNGTASIDPVARNLCKSENTKRIKISIVGGLYDIEEDDKFIYTIKFNGETLLIESSTGFVNEAFIICKPAGSFMRLKVRATDYNLIDDEIILDGSADLKFVDDEFVTLNLRDNLGELIIRVDTDDENSKDCITCGQSLHQLPEISFGYLNPEDYLTYERLLAEPGRRKIPTQSGKMLIEVNSKIIGDGVMMPGGLIWQSSFNKGEGHHDMKSAVAYCQQKGARLPTLDEAYALCQVLDGSRCTSGKKAAKAVKVSALSPTEKNKNLVLVTKPGSDQPYLYNLRIGNAYKLDDESGWPVTCVDDRYAH
jgi:hypothetical protein